MTRDSDGKKPFPSYFSPRCFAIILPITSHYTIVYPDLLTCHVYAPVELSIRRLGGVPSSNELLIDMKQKCVHIPLIIPFEQSVFQQ
jgi:hypothetical protein